MDAETILRELTYPEGLPKEALEAASAQRSEMLPLFLNQIETYLALEPAARAKPTPLFFIFHLLGEWREKTAYGPLARLLRIPGHEVDAIFGDGITTTSHRVMAALFEGDPEPLYNIILDPKADEFIRAGMREALAMLTFSGELDRALTGRFLCDAFTDLQPQAQNFVWVGWQSAIAMLGMSDLKALKQAFDQGFIDSHILGFEHFERDLRRAIEHPGEPWPSDNHATRFLATPSKNFPDGTASPSNTEKTSSGGSGRQKLIAPAANGLRIPSGASDETIRVRAAAARSQRNAALLQRGSGRSIQR